jgi:hypothetical protein
MGERLSRSVTALRGRSLPEPAVPTGYSALIDRYELKLPLPPRLSAIAGRHHPRSTPAWQLLTPRHRPDPTLAGELVFALKWEGVDLSLLAALFKSVPAGEIDAIVRATPTGGFARRIWFLYEWLTEPSAGRRRSGQGADGHGGGPRLAGGRRTGDPVVTSSSGQQPPRHSAVLPDGPTDPGPRRRRRRGVRPARERGHRPRSPRPGRLPAKGTEYRLRGRYFVCVRPSGVPAPCYENVISCDESVS